MIDVTDTRGQRSQTSRARWRPRPAIVMLVLVVATNAWLLRGVAIPAHNLNDASVHTAYVGWAADRLGSGQLPLDGLFTQLGMGFPIFHHYQVLPHLLVAPFALVLGAAWTVSLSTFLLLALWPLCIYAASRLFGFGRWPAAAAAAVAPFLVSLPAYGYEASSYLWRGYGMWPQLWGMWLLPLALATTWRAVVKGRSLLLAAALAGLTLSCHLLTGYLLLLALALWVIVNPRPFLTRLWRATAVAAGAVATAAWLLVPALLDQGWTRLDVGPGTFWIDSHGAPKVVRWLASGELFDHGRAPLVTTLAGIGALLCLARWRRDEAGRAVVAFTALSLVLFAGRPTFGAVLDHLPGIDSVLLHRMIIGVHLGAVLLAGIGLAWLGGQVSRAGAKVLGRRATSPLRWAAVAAVALLLLPAVHQLDRYASEDRSWASDQRAADASPDSRDFAHLVDLVQARGDGRVYAGLMSNWGFQYRLGAVQAPIELLNLGADAIGFTGRIPSLTEPSERRFDETNPAHYELFNIRYVIAPVERAGPAGAVLLASQGRHRLWQVPTNGYARVIDLTAPIVSTRQGLDVAMTEYLRSDLPLRGRSPLLALDGREASTPFAASPAAGPAGSVEHLDPDLSSGRVSATVVAARSAAVIIPVSFHGRWRATVDGLAVEPVAVAPGLLAIPVSPGRHDVVARYEPVSPLTTVALFGLGLVVLVLLAMLDRRSRRRDGTGSGQPLVVGAEVVREDFTDVVGATVVAGAVVADTVVDGEAAVVGEATGTRVASDGSSLTASATA